MGIEFLNVELFNLGARLLFIRDPGQKVLLTQRTDNGRWCLPGGRLDPGESVEECCVREVLEEDRLDC